MNEGFGPTLRKQANGKEKPSRFLSMKAGGRKHGSPIYRLVCGVLNISAVI